MSNPTVSIVIPAYNASNYIAHAIRSALDQTYQSAEIIVVDDGSTDGSLEVIRGFGDQVRWESGPNRGACSARNRGLELARGELIQFLDADDLLHPRKLELQVAEIERSNADLVYCDREVIGQTVTKHSLSIGEDPVIFVLRDTLQTAQPLHARKHLIAIGGFCEDLPCAQERDLHLRLACRGVRFHHLPEVLVTVRRVAGSLSSDSKKVLDQHAAIAWRGYKILQHSGKLTDVRAEALAGWLASDARLYLRHGLHDKAKSYFEQARQMHPSAGIAVAYSRQTRILRKFVGPLMTERLVSMKRGLRKCA